MLSSAIEPASKSKFYPLEVREARRDTADALIVTFRVPAEVEELFRFVQGQHLTLRAQIDGEEVRRSYSICSAVQDGTLRVGIKQVPGGWFSAWAAEHLKAGATVEVMPPVGHFFVPLDQNTGNITCFSRPAAGSRRCSRSSRPRSLRSRIVESRCFMGTGRLNRSCSGKSWGT